MPGRASGFKTPAAEAEYRRWYDEAVASSPVPVIESDVETSFGTTHVLTAGDPSKPPLVALHGLSISSTMWLPLLPALTAAHHVRMLDAVGDLNKTVSTTVMSSPARVVAWLQEVLDTLRIERAAFVALSIGTWMATHYAMASPDRVERMALLAPAGIVSPQHTRWILESVAKLKVRPTEVKTERALDTYVMEASRTRLRTDPWRSVAQQFIVGMPTFRRNWREPRPVKCNLQSLAMSRIPLLALIPRNETLHDGPTMAKRFREQLPHAEVELIDDANHIVVIDQPDVVDARLRQFLGTP
jgi:pimeloyl-ACP methyl ester carboxylesterase